MTITTIQSLAEVVESKITQDNPVTKSSISSWCCTHWRNIAAEFVATLMLLLLGCMPSIPIEGFQSPVIPPLGFGTMVMLNIQIFGHLSGAHMNPAVTLAAVIFGTLSVPVGIAYAIAQCAGAIAGYGILGTLSVMDLSERSVCVTLTHPDLNVVQGVGIEVAITIALILINCAVWDPVNKDKQENVPVKFALTILGLSLVGGPMTGASMNPARSLGPALWNNNWTNHWVYWVGPLLGSVFATILYKITFTSSQMRSEKAK